MDEIIAKKSAAVKAIVNRKGLPGCFPYHYQAQLIEKYAVPAL
jgi:hypothetical protein